MSLDVSEFNDALTDKFEFVEERRKKHDSLAFYFENRKVAVVLFSRGSKFKTFDDGMLSHIARNQLNVGTLNFLKGMVDCTRNLEDYVKRLKELDIIKVREQDENDV